MPQRFCCRLLAATVVATALGGVATPASAAIRVVINDGSNTRVFYSSDDATALFTTTLGTYDIVVGSTVTNFSSQSGAGGFISQSLTLSDGLSPGPAPLPMLSVTAAVIDAVAGVSSGLVTGGNEALVLGASLARFTLPATSTLQVSSDVDGNAAMGMAT